MRHDPVGVAFLYRSQAATALRGGREFHLRGVLDRQHMPPGKSRAGSQAPTFDDLRGRHPRVGEEPTRLQFATAVTTQPAQAYRLARNHPFEDRTPPLSRRTSPNDPSDHSISAPVLRLPGPTESYSRRVGQGISQIDTMANITCAHALAPSQGQALAQVSVAAGEPHPHTRRRRDHPRSTASTRRRACSSTCASTRTDGPPGSTISIRPDGPADGTQTGPARRRGSPTRATRAKPAASAGR